MFVSVKRSSRFDSKRIYLRLKLLLKIIRSKRKRSTSKEDLLSILWKFCATIMQLERKINVFFFLQIYLVIIFIRVFDEEKNYSTGYDTTEEDCDWLFCQYFYPSRNIFDRYFFIRKITDFVNSLLEKYLTVINL